MSKKDEAKHRARYTLEFKLEAVRLVNGGQEASVTARILGVPKQSLSNWVRLAQKGELQGAGDRPVSAEQMELARLRAELARVKMERDILKKRQRTLQRIRCEVRLDRQAHRDVARLRCSKNPLALTPSTSHISVTGQSTTFLAIQAYFTVSPLRSTPSLF